MLPGFDGSKGMVALLRLMLMRWLQMLRSPTTNGALLEGLVSTAAEHQYQNAGA